MQTLNFYSDEYRPQPLRFDSRFGAVVLVISVIMLSIIGGLKSSRTNQLQAQLQNQKGELKETESQTKRLQQQFRGQLISGNLDEKIQQQQKNVNGYRKILAKINQSDSNIPIQYSRLLNQLAAQNTHPVWLTRIIIQSQDLNLYGRSLKPEAIPAYVNALKKSDLLNRQFDELLVSRDEQDTRLINFSLTHGRLPNGR